MCELVLNKGRVFIVMDVKVMLELLLVVFFCFVELKFGFVEIILIIDFGGIMFDVGVIVG